MKFNNTLLAGALCTSLFSWSHFAAATIVEFDTSLGKVTVNLYDDTTEATVTNFLNYVNSGAYTNSIIHRSIPGFIVQGGGIVYDFSSALQSVAADSPVVNEPVYSNVRGTIAMAKLPGNPNSATSEYFFNLADNNPANNDNSLDVQNEGFTVFGQVVEGMDVIDAMAALPTIATSNALTNLPLRNYPPADGTDGFVATEDHYMLINSIDIVDAATDTAVGLTRPLTTRDTTPPPTPTPTPTPSTGGGGGGHFGGFGLLILGFAAAMRRWVK